MKFETVYNIFSLHFRYLLVEVEDVIGPEEITTDTTTSLVDQMAQTASIGGREIKDKLTELFTPNKFKSSPKIDSLPTEAPKETKREQEASGSLEWSVGYMPRGKSEITEACRQAFTATCHLLLEGTTFPVYLTEEETWELYAAMFDHTGQRVNRTFKRKLQKLLELTEVVTFVLHRQQHPQPANVAAVTDDAVLPVQGLLHPAYCCGILIRAHQPLAVLSTCHPGQAQALPHD